MSPELFVGQVGLGSVLAVLSWWSRRTPRVGRKVWEGSWFRERLLLVVQPAFALALLSSAVVTVSAGRVPMIAAIMGLPLFAGLISAMWAMLGLPLPRRVYPDWYLARERISDGESAGGP